MKALLRLRAWLGLLACSLGVVSTQAAPPAYQDLYAHPERAMPMQPHWQLQPVASSAPPWAEIFMFQIGADPRHMDRLHWLSLNPDPNTGLAPALFDALEGHTLFLAPSARSFCDGRWQVVRVDSHNNSSVNNVLQPATKVWLVQHKPHGRREATTAYGRLDAQGHWAVPPVRCDGSTTGQVFSPDAVAYLMPGDARPLASDLKLDLVYAQPGLRDARGRWLAPVPPSDITTAQWMDYKKQIVTPGSLGSGVIDPQGRMVIPFTFGDLPDATAQRRIQLCSNAGLRLQRDASTPRVCRWQRLQRSQGGEGLRPVKDAATGRWGYQNARGQWVIAPQFHAARRFRHGYAVVTALFAEDWRPPGWQDEWPMIRQYWRMGRYWVAQALVRNPSTAGQWAIRYGLMNDAGQWLAPQAQLPLQITVPSPAGGRNAYFAQILATQLPALLGRQVEVKHLPDASVADYERLAADGGNRRLLFTAMTLPRGGIPGLHQGPPIDTALRSLLPVTVVASQPWVLAIDSTQADALGIGNTDNLLAYARAHPGALRVGTGDDGWVGQLAWAELLARSGVDLRRVVFPGRYPDSDVLTQAHAVELVLAPVNGVASAVRGGQLRVLGSTADPGHPQSLDGVVWPTLGAHASLAGLAVYDHFILWAAANSDAAANRTLQQAIAQVLAKPELQQQLQNMQAVGGGGSPESLLALEAQMREAWLRALALPAR
ncbi:tripartite tricarboxylate transporter substrate-binding protein [Comamonas sp. JUb58]|uniref:WG repeat-containing protein n=1 Tax=Comamonas sp. JUb58 TaxID=2485114 RepID=UPI0010E21C0F|nr:tripartite tricarboxylate transporter substrate-binding protein [Comamonas sp. JUb58]TDS85236.1 tripartite-type tricarboxylate transporter receptor subunit TctC [Comamonas sp. JUb58]